MWIDEGKIEVGVIRGGRPNAYEISTRQYFYVFFLVLVTLLVTIVIWPIDLIGHFPLHWFIKGPLSATVSDLISIYRISLRYDAT